MTDLEAKKLLLSTPGDSIQETIDEIGMSQAELAERLGRSVPKLNELIKGKAPITKETATKLEYVLGIPASFWLNLERQYQDELLEIEQMEFLMQCTDWIKKFPLSLLKKANVLPKTNNKTELAENLLKFFKVASPQQWSHIYNNSSIAFKIELKHTTEPEAISSWLRLGEIWADKMSVVTFDKKLIRERLEEIQILSYETPANWLNTLQTICAECGIALVYSPSISKAPIYGASRWIKNNNTPLIQLTDRRKDNNAFWFSFYHELGHVLLHGKKDVFIDGLDNIAQDKDKEQEADAFAARMLLSDKERNELNKYPSFDKATIISLSRKFRKHPGIIISQLQRIDRISYNDMRLNSLKEKVVFTNYPDYA